MAAAEQNNGGSRRHYKLLRGDGGDGTADGRLLRGLVEPLFSSRGGTSKLRTGIIITAISATGAPGTAGSGDDQVAGIPPERRR